MTPFSPATTISVCLLSDLDQTCLPRSSSPVRLLLAPSFWPLAELTPPAISAPPSLPPLPISPGATGTAGSETLLQLLLHPSISRISVLARSPLPPTLLAALPAEAVQAKLSVIVMDDFEVYPEEVMSQLQGHEACIWTLGISYGLVEKEEYRRLTLGYAVSSVSKEGGERRGEAGQERSSQLDLRLHVPAPSRR